MTAVPDEGASQLKPAQVIGGLLVVAHQYPPALGEPTQGAFHHPPSGGKGFLAPSVQLLLPNAPDMRTVPEGSNGPVAGGIVIPLVQAQVLGAFRACHYDALQGRPQEFRVMATTLARVSQPPPRSGGRQLRPPGCSACSQLCPGRWGCVQWRPPNRALPMEQSADCHSQSTPPNSWHSSIRAAQMPSSTPPPTQRWKVRWMVLSSPNSLGKWFHWQPLRIRKIMPSSIFPWSARLRPRALGRSNCNITGSIRSQRSSGTSRIVGNGFPSSTIHLHPSLGIILPTTLSH